MTGEAYVELLLERQSAHLEQHPVPESKPWLAPVLEWFVRHEDEALAPRRERLSALARRQTGGGA